MKKVLFLFAFLLLGIGAMAQKVIYEKVPYVIRWLLLSGRGMRWKFLMTVSVS